MLQGQLGVGRNEDTAVPRCPAACGRLPQCFGILISSSQFETISGYSREIKEMGSKTQAPGLMRS